MEKCCDIHALPTTKRNILKQKTSRRKIKPTVVIDYLVITWLFLGKHLS